MKKPACISIAICFAMFILLASKSTEVKKKYISIQQAEESGAIHLDITSTGSHSGNCIDMEISNKRDDSGYYRLEAGRRLKASDSTAQDILVTKEQHISLAAGEKKHLSVAGFCCQVHHHGPHPKSIYSVGKMANPDLLMLAQYLNENHFPLEAEQYAVWVISDNNKISSITAEHMDSILALRNMVAKIKHVENTWYWVSYENDTARLFSGRHSKVSGNLNYYVASNAVVNISIYDSYGMLIKTLSDGPANPEHYTYNLSLDVKGWLNGKYYIRITQDDIKSVEKTFEL